MIIQKICAVSTHVYESYGPLGWYYKLVFLDETGKNNGVNWDSEGLRTTLVRVLSTSTRT